MGVNVLVRIVNAIVRRLTARRGLNLFRKLFAESVVYLLLRFFNEEEWGMD